MSLKESIEVHSYKLNNIKVGNELEFRIAWLITSFNFGGSGGGGLYQRIKYLHVLLLRLLYISVTHPLGLQGSNISSMLLGATTVETNCEHVKRKWVNLDSHRST